MIQIRYVVKYRTKSDVKAGNGYIQERLRFTLADANKLKNELLTWDYIEYLGMRIEKCDSKSPMY